MKAFTTDWFNCLDTIKDLAECYEIGKRCLCLMAKCTVFNHYLLTFHLMGADCFS